MVKIFRQRKLIVKSKIFISLLGLLFLSSSYDVSAAVTTSCIPAGAEISTDQQEVRRASEDCHIEVLKSQDARFSSIIVDEMTVASVSSSAAGASSPVRDCPAATPDISLGAGNTFSEWRTVNDQLCPRSESLSNFCTCVAQNTATPAEPPLYTPLGRGQVRNMADTIMDYVRFAKLIEARNLYRKVAYDMAVASRFDFLAPAVQQNSNSPCYPGNMGRLANDLITGGKCTQEDIDSMSTSFNSFATNCTTGRCRPLFPDQEVRSGENQLDAFNRDFSEKFNSAYNNINGDLDSAGEASNQLTSNLSEYMRLPSEQIIKDEEFEIWQNAFVQASNDPDFPDLSDPAQRSVALGMASNPLFSHHLSPFSEVNWPENPRNEIDPSTFRELLQFMVSQAANGHAREPGQSGSGRAYNLSSITDFSKFLKEQIIRYSTDPSRENSLTSQCVKMTQALEQYCEMKNAREFSVAEHLTGINNPKTYLVLAESMANRSFNAEPLTRTQDERFNYFVGKTDQVLCSMSGTMSGIWTEDGFLEFNRSRVFTSFTPEQLATTSAGTDGAPTIFLASEVVHQQAFERERRKERLKNNQLLSFNEFHSANELEVINTANLENTTDSDDYANNYVDEPDDVSDLPGGSSLVNSPGEVSDYNSNYVSNVPASTGSVEQRSPASVGATATTDENGNTGNGASGQSVADANAAISADLRRQLEALRQQLQSKQTEIDSLNTSRAQAVAAGEPTSAIDSELLAKQRELAELERDILDRRSRLASVSTPAAAPTAVSDTRGQVSSGQVGGTLGATSSRTPTTSALPASGGVISSGAPASAAIGAAIGVGNGTPSTGSLQTLGIITNYNGPQLSLNGESFNPSGKMIIEVSTLNSASEEELRQIYDATAGRIVYVLFPDNTIREYQGSVTINGRVVYLPQGQAAVEEGRSVASVGEVESSDGVTEGSTERAVKHGDLEATIDSLKD